MNKEDDAKTVLADAAAAAVVAVAAADARLLLAKALDHEARISVLERKSDRRVAAISGATSVVVALVAALAGGCTVPAVQRPTPEQTREVRRSVVLITGDGLWGDYHATGWFVSARRVVTAGHACEDDTDISGTAADGTKFHLVPVLDHDDTASMTGDDVCVLIPVGYHSETWLPLAASVPRLGEHIWTLGYQYGEVLVPSDGFIGEPALSIPKYTGTDLVGAPGNSGGPVMNDRGEVVGIVSRGVDPVILLVPLEILVVDLNFVKEPE